MYPFNVSAYQLTEFARGLEVPWSMMFTDENRMVFTERPGRLRVIEDGVLQPKPLAEFPEVSTRSEEGLMGLATLGGYDHHSLYVCLAYETSSGMQTKVVRYRDAGDTLADETIILDTIPAAQFHAGCRLRFGPDGMLYITTGDATDGKIAQNLQSLGGKILRLEPDGSIPADNPFPGSPVWSYGHRNPQGLDWHAESGFLVATEHGPSGFDGAGGGDEVNRIVKGGNYGWPVVSHGKHQDGMLDPLRVYTPAEAPASGMFYRGDAFPELQGSYLFGALRGEGIWRLAFDASGKVLLEEKWDLGLGRIREITEGPDGSLYFSTSNVDGRGSRRPGDDKIFRLTKETNEAEET